MASCTSARQFTHRHMNVLRVPMVQSALQSADQILLRNTAACLQAWGLETSSPCCLK